jgi:hypothetical protein
MPFEMPMHELFEAVRRVCIEQVPLDEVFGAHAADVARLKVYQEFVGQHQRETLEHVYPKTLKELALRDGESSLPTLRAEFFRAHPPTSWDQNANALPFVDFLQAQRPHLPPFVHELGHYEWHDFAVAVSVEVIPEPEEVHSPILNPTLSLLPVHYDLRTWVAAPNDAGPGSGAEPAPLEAILALFRHPQKDRTYVLELTAIDLVVLKMLHEAVPIESVLAETGLARQDLDEAMAHLAQEHALIATPKI